jgi:hypothetical protein
MGMRVAKEHIVEERQFIQARREEMYNRLLFYCNCLLTWTVLQRRRFAAQGKRIEIGLRLWCRERKTLAS